MEYNHLGVRFITIEGGDGAGKSSMIPIIKEHLEQQGFEVVTTREPGGTTLGESLRSVILEKPMSNIAETLLLFAARSQHITEVIEPNLSSGKVVLCDRFTDSTVVYQCKAKGVSIKDVNALARIVQDGLEPGLTLSFNVPLDISKARLKKTGKTLDKFEREPDDFKIKVQEGYLELVKNNPNRCKLVDSSVSIEDTKRQVIDILNDYIPKMLPPQKKISP